MPDSTFLDKLEKEAEQQAKLYQTEILPGQLEGVARFVVKHSWQVLAALSLVTAAFVTWY